MNIFPRCVLLWCCFLFASFSIFRSAPLFFVKAQCIEKLTKKRKCHREREREREREYYTDNEKMIFNGFSEKMVLFAQYIRINFLLDSVGRLNINQVVDLILILPVCLNSWLLAILLVHQSFDYREITWISAQEFSN